MKLLIITCLLFIFNDIVLPQIMSDQNNFNPQGYYNPGLFYHVSDIAVNNPSFLSEFKKPSAGFSYQWDSQMKEIYGINYKRKLNFVPVSAGIVYPAGIFCFGISFSKKYNLSREFSAQLTTMEDPAGTGRIITDKFILEELDYSAIASVNLDNLIGNCPLSLGFRVSLNNLNISDEFSSFESTINVSTFNFSAGVNYKLYLSTVSTASFSLFFEKGMNYEDYTDVKSNYDPNLIYTRNNDAIPLIYIPVKLFLTNKNPDILNFTAKFKLNQAWELAQSFNNVYWHNVSARYKNQLESFSQLLYTPSDIVTYSAGLFFTDKRANDDYMVDYFGMFLSAGVELRTGNFEYGIVLSDSHLGSADSRKQTSVKCFLGYHL